MISLPPTNPRSLRLAAVLAWLSPASAHAEDSVQYKYADYRESAGRIAVETHGAYVTKDFGPDTRLKLEGVLDALAGATPNGQPAPDGSDQVPLASMTERRKAWSAQLSRQLQRVNIAIGAANSRESDYVSTGWSLNALTDFNQKNTTLLLGLAGTSDEIKVFHQTPWETKRTVDVIAGVTQLLNPQTSVTLNVAWGQQHGYLSDPYKLVQKDTEIFPGIFLPLTFAENRPDFREKRIFQANLKRAWARARGALDATYRFYDDTNGVHSHTVDVAWFQRLGERVIVRPALRFYDQSAARFYHYRLIGTAIVPEFGPPRPQGPFYSSDYRLSALQTVTYGLKVIGRLTDNWQLDAAYERYDMRGRDGVTPRSAYSRANVVTLGARLSW